MTKKKAIMQVHHYILAYLKKNSGPGLSEFNRKSKHFQIEQ